MVRFFQRRMGRGRYRRRRTSRVYRKSNRRMLRRRYRRRRSAPLIAPASVMIKHRYVTWVNQDPGSVVDNKFQKTYRANGLFDPDAALGGHQPSGFDFWSGKYRNYVVLGSKITIRPLGQGSSATCNRLDLTDDAFAPNYLSNESMLSEQSGSITATRWWGNVNQWLGKGDILTKKFSLKARGDPRDAANHGSSTSVPTNEWFFHWTQMVAGAMDPGPTTCMIQIDYIAKWFNRIPETVKN